MNLNRYDGFWTYITCINNVYTCLYQKVQHYNKKNPAESFIIKYLDRN